MSTTETLVFLAVIGSRFFVPLLIPKFPLPTIIACLVLDAADQSIFQRMGYDPPGYQSYDKAMDVWYLAMAWLSTLRNWSSIAAFSVSRFLYFYRLVGVVAFELTGVRACSWSSPTPSSTSSSPTRPSGRGGGPCGGG